MLGFLHTLCMSDACMQEPYLIMSDRLLRLLESAVNPKVNGRTMYFSYSADITQTTQRAATLAASKEEASKPLALRADPRFFWNKALLAPLLGMSACSWAFHHFSCG